MNTTTAQKNTANYVYLFPLLSIHIYHSLISFNVHHPLKQKQWQTTIELLLYEDKISESQDKNNF